MKKTNKKMLIIVLLLAILLCLYFVSSTYSKYISTTTSNSTVTAAKWSIKLNDIDVSSGKQIENNKLLVLTPVDNDKVAKGTIAPTSTAQGTIELDPKGTQVALKYTITLGKPTYGGTKTAPNVTITGLKIGDNEVALTNSSYTGTIALPGTTGSKTAMTSAEIKEITVIATWTSSTDAEDTAVGIEAGTITVPVTVTVEQDV